MSSKFFNDVKKNFRPLVVASTIKAKPKPSIFVGIPVHDSRVHTCFMMGMWEIVSQHDEQGVPKYKLTCVKTSGGGITKARNDLVWQFMKGTWDYIWFTDSDMQLNHLHLDALLAADVDIIGVMYAHKKIDLVWSARHLPDAEIKDGKQEVAGVGFGGVLIKRRVFEVMQEKMPELRFSETWSHGRNEYKYGFFQERVAIDTEAGATEPEWQTEDWFFTHNARKLGFKVYAASSFTVQHHEGGQQFPNHDVMALADVLMTYKDGLKDDGKLAGEVMRDVLPGYFSKLVKIEPEKP